MYRGSGFASRKARLDGADAQMAPSDQGRIYCNQGQAALEGCAGFCGVGSYRVRQFSMLPKSLVHPSSFALSAPEGNRHTLSPTLWRFIECHRVLFGNRRPFGGGLWMCRNLRRSLSGVAWVTAIVYRNLDVGVAGQPADRMSARRLIWTRPERKEGVKTMEVLVNDLECDEISACDLHAL